MTKLPPRKTPSRDEYYMGMAFWWASKSKDPGTQVGAIIVSSEHKPLGMGYNGPPSQINDEELNWDRPFKYDYIEHAEENAIDHSERQKIPGSTIYVTHKPCKKCMLKIVKNGIKKVIYFPTKVTDQSSMLRNDVEMDKTMEIAVKAGVEVIPFKGKLNWMRERMVWMESVGVFD